MRSWRPSLLTTIEGVRQLPQRLGLSPTAAGSAAFGVGAEVRLPLVGPQRAALAVRVGGHSTEGRVATIDMHELAGAGGGRAALLAEVRQSVPS